MAAMATYSGCRVEKNTGIFPQLREVAKARSVAGESLHGNPELLKICLDCIGDPQGVVGARAMGYLPGYVAYEV